MAPITDNELLRAALAGYEQQLADIQNKMEEIRKRLGGKVPASAPARIAAARPNRLSPAARARIAAAQHRRWAKVRAAKKTAAKPKAKAKVKLVPIAKAATAAAGAQS